MSVTVSRTCEMPGLSTMDIAAQYLRENRASGPTLARRHRVARIGARMQLSVLLATYRQNRDIVGGRPVAKQGRHHRGTHQFCRRVDDVAAEEIETFGDGPVAALDQPVGIEQQAVAHLNRHEGVVPRSVGVGAERQVRGDRSQARRLIRSHDHGRQMTGARQRQARVRRIHDGVNGGSHRVRFEQLDLAIEASQHIGRIDRLQRIRAKCAANAAHHDRRPQATPGDIADRDADMPGWQCEQVVPVATDADLGSGYVARGDVQTGYRRRARRQQAALESYGRVAIHPGQPRLRREARAIGDQPEQFDVLVGEVTDRFRTDMQDADDSPAGDHGYAEHRYHALRAQYRIDDVHLVDVLDRDRLGAGGDTASEAGADRDPYALPDLLLE